VLGRAIAYALIVSQAVRPKSKQPTVRWWHSGDTTLASDLGVMEVATVGRNPTRPSGIRAGQSHHDHTD